MTARPWPFEPLYELSGCDSMRQMCDKVRTSGHAVYRAAKEGLTDVQADRWAVRCGYHPSEVWGDAWFDHVDPVGALFAELRDEVEAA